MKIYLNEYKGKYYLIIFSGQTELIDTISKHLGISDRIHRLRIDPKYIERVNKYKRERQATPPELLEKGIQNIARRGETDKHKLREDYLDPDEKIDFPKEVEEKLPFLGYAMKLYIPLENKGAITAWFYYDGKITIHRGITARINRDDAINIFEAFMMIYEISKTFLYNLKSTNV